MTFSNIPLAVDGALTSSALIRKGFFASFGGGEGVVKATDLKVSASSPAGQSLRVSAGTGVVLNGYQSTPSESYIVSNPATHVITSGEMPGAAGTTSYYLVAVVVGDPQYGQTGHPFMPSDFDEAQANSYQYVRPVLFPCNANTTKFAELGKSFPGLALARLAIPANTTTILDAHITDVRVQPKESRPVGEVTMFYGAESAIAPGWLPMKGQAFDGGVYPALAAHLGGNVLPNMTDRFPVGVSGTKALGAAGGSSSHGHTLPAHGHGHNLGTSSIGHTGSDNAATTASGNDRVARIDGSVSGNHSHSVTGGVANAGAIGIPGVDHTPPFLAMWFIIRAV